MIWLVMTKDEIGRAFIETLRRSGNPNSYAYRNDRPPDGWPSDHKQLEEHRQSRERPRFQLRVQSATTDHVGLLQPGTGYRGFGAGSY
ncbi:hypothetical protein EV128_12382 [Rhizobium azibense]|nr:hypothetical protein EV128_12382 [Rhizobium azibense]